MKIVFDILFTHTWWQYNVHSVDLFDTIYHWFNILEGCAWILFALLVLIRFLKNCCSTLELWYCFSFFSFAMTDFYEAFAQTSWLIWLKLINLILLLMIRRKVMTKHYPAAKLY